MQVRTILMASAALVWLLTGAQGARAADQLPGMGEWAQETMDSLPEAVRPKAVVDAIKLEARDLLAQKSVVDLETQLVLDSVPVTLRMVVGSDGKSSSGGSGGVGTVVSTPSGRVTGGPRVSRFARKSGPRSTSWRLPVS
jgi:hypothetical protein